MSTLFGLLSFLSLIVFIIGLTKPSLLKISWLSNRKRVTAIFIPLTIALFVIGVAIPSTPSKTPEQATTPKVPEQINQFNVPVLIGKNIDEIRSILGQPADKDPELTQEQLKLGATEWWNTFRKGGEELLVTFNPNTRNVIDFFIGGNDKSRILEVGNLQENALNYSVEFVKDLKNPSKITGVKIIPKQ